MDYLQEIVVLCVIVLVLVVGVFWYIQNNSDETLDANSNGVVEKYSMKLTEAVDTPTTSEQIDPPSLILETGPEDAELESVVEPTPAVAPAPAVVTKPVSSTIAPTPTRFTIAEVARHASAESCWTAIEGKVYNITSYIPFHPGGPEVAVLACGIDATKDYQAEKAHSKPNGKADAELAKLYIGELI